MSDSLETNPIEIRFALQCPACGFQPRPAPDSTRDNWVRQVSRSEPFDLHYRDLDRNLTASCPVCGFWWRVECFDPTRVEELERQLRGSTDLSGPKGNSHD